MEYISPFGAMGDGDHNGPDALCLSRTHCTDAVDETLKEFHVAALSAIGSRAPQPAFFLARQLAELALKALLGRSPRTHNLTDLVEQLALAGDDLLAGGADQQLVLAFINDLGQRDKGGDEGRYPTRTDGTLALADVCCADPTLLREHVDRLHGYVQARLSERVASPVVDLT